MLKGIPPIISPELLKVLCEMGHGDTIVIADGNFPSLSVAKYSILVPCYGHGVPEILDAVLRLFPLDTYTEKPATLMDITQGDTVKPPIWDTYNEILAKYDDRGASAFGKIERFDFYDEAKKAFAVIATSEKAQYANIILKKGVVLYE